MHLNQFATRLATVCSAALLAGCMTQQAAPPPLIPANFAAQTQPQINVPPDPLDELAPSIRSAYLSHDPSPVRDGFAWIFPYQPHQQITVNCAPRHLTQIIIADDEHIVEANAADTARWAFHISGNRLVVKPDPNGGASQPNGNAGAQAMLGTTPVVMPTNFSTNLIIQGDKRSYDVLLHSGSLRSAMELVTYYFPEDIATAETARHEAMRKAAQQNASTPPQQLDFNYQITGPDVPWKPVAAFSDSSHEYLQFSDNAMLLDDAPTLYVQRGKNTELVNYSRRGSYFVVDRLYTDAALTEGLGSDRQTVRIQATGATH